MVSRCKDSDSDIKSVAKFPRCTKVAEPHGWTHNDKKDLMMALKKYGESDFDILQKELPRKSLLDIRNTIEYYKERARSKCVANADSSLDEVKKWIDVVQKINGSQGGYDHDLIRRALKYIALFEKKSEMSDINLSDAYLFLSEVCSGWTAKELSDRTAYFLYQCLVRLAENLQKNDSSELQAYLNQLEDIKNLTKNSDEFMINPLKIPDNLLKLTRAETDIDVLQPQEQK